MSSKKAKCGSEESPTSFLSILRHFLSPDVFRQAHQAAADPKRADARWTLHPLLMVLLFSCWAAGDSTEERFHTARIFYVRFVAPGRRRPGKTPEGFLLALCRLPCCVLRSFASALRLRIAQLFCPLWSVAGFVPFGCDGTRLACPRTAELERYLSQDSSEDSKDSTAPQVWLTAIVHLRLGILWSWLVGKPDASEREHLQRLAPNLPANALIVTDAGYQGYEMASMLDDADVAFLMRVSSQTLFYFAGAPVDPSAWVDGMVYWWTTEARQKGLPPLEVRLMRVYSSTGKSEVWMVSNVRESSRLSLEQAGNFYRMRWENEGFFRTYKMAMKKVKLTSRTVRLIHREVEGSMLAVQLLLAMGAWAVAKAGKGAGQVSPAAVLREIRWEMEDKPKRGRGHFLGRLRRCVRDQRPRTSSKVRRVWPKRKDHKPPKPPKLRTMDGKVKSVFDIHLQRMAFSEC